MKSKTDNSFQKYEDLVLDLSYSILRDMNQTEALIKRVRKVTEKPLRTREYQGMERIWVLSQTCDQLLHLGKRFGFQIKPSAQFNFQSKLDSQGRLDHFEYFFHRLPMKERIILLLKDRYGISYSEIGTILSKPESSIKITRQHALRTLEEWIWEGV